jgi:hypothetical protein
MLLILIIFCVNVLLCVALARSRSKERVRAGVLGDGISPSPAGRSLFWHAISQEFRALLIVITVLCTFFLLLLVYAYIFGPIPPIHEWGN